MNSAKLPRTVEETPREERPKLPIGYFCFLGSLILLAGLSAAVQLTTAQISEFPNDWPLRREAAISESIRVDRLSEIEGA